MIRLRRLVLSFREYAHSRTCPLVTSRETRRYGFPSQRPSLSGPSSTPLPQQWRPDGGPLLTPGQSPEQLLQSSPDSQTPFPQLDEQAGSLAQSGSAQSAPLLQSLSIPSVQLVSVAGGAPQSAGQLHWSSPASHDASPQNGGSPQSTAQLKLSSVPSQTKSPQQDGVAGVLVQVLPLAEQRESPQPIGFCPSPSPQQ